MALEAVNKALAKVRLEVVEDWRGLWKVASVRTPALGIAVMGAAEILGSSWQQLPPDLRHYIPHADQIAMGLFALALIGRFLKKTGKSDGPNR